VHLVGFIIRIFHDARSSECQIFSIHAHRFKLRSYIEKIKGIYMKGLQSPKQNNIS